MPYIEPWRRASLVAPNVQPANPGELNFTITSIVEEYLHRMGVRYANINEVIGVLECAKLELYRRVAAPYEDGKRAENGDVYRSA